MPRSLLGGVRRRVRSWTAGAAPVVPPAPDAAVPPLATLAEQLQGDVRGLKNLRLGPEAFVTLETPVNVMRPLNVQRRTTIGAFTYLNTGFIDRLESIGRYCSIGQDVRVGESNHPTDWLSTSTFQYNPGRFGWSSAASDYGTFSTEIDGVQVRGGPARIGNDVWIGARATILRDVRIGDGAVVAAGAVVVRDVDPYSIVGGVPAKPIRSRFAPALVERLLASRWWEFAPNDLNGADFTRPEAALEFVEGLRAEGRPAFEGRVLHFDRASLRAGAVAAPPS